MQVFQGKSVSEGITIGPLVVWKKDHFIAERKIISDVAKEIARVEAALALSKLQLRELRKKVVPYDTILEAHLMLLEDDGFAGRVRQLIQTEQVNAEYAVQQVGEEIAEMFIQMEDEYMRAREADIRDIAERMLDNLSGQKAEVPVLTKASIILAEDLSPGETMRFDRDKVLAFVTMYGSVNSHAAILARSMGIPALAGIDLEQVLPNNSCLAIVDALDGQLILEPDDKTMEEYAFKLKLEQERKNLLQAFNNQESVTLDGQKIHICANIGTAREVQDALENGADGIGLYRSEFLYMGKKDFPSEEEQYEEYKRTVTAMEDRRVIIRTVDMGSDKQADYFALEKETNPALGYRGIRVCLDRQDIFKTQLRALFRAAVSGNLAIMYPMITSVEEVEQIAKLVKAVSVELEEQGIPYKIPAQGVMIETPAAVMISDELAEMVDFFSIGTNDLTQYTLAIDRQNGKLEDLYNPRHKAIIKMIQMVVNNAHSAGKWVGICGELAGDTTFTEKWIRMGVDELSVVPDKVLEIRKIVRESKVQEV